MYVSAHDQIGAVAAKLSPPITTSLPNLHSHRGYSESNMGTQLMIANVEHKVMVNAHSSTAKYLCLFAASATFRF